MPSYFMHYHKLCDLDHIQSVLFVTCCSDLFRFVFFSTELNCSEYFCFNMTIVILVDLHGEDSSDWLHFDNILWLSKYNTMHHIATIPQCT